MSDTIDARSAFTFEAPAPGYWELESSHHGVRPLSPYLRGAYVRAFERGTKTLTAAYGLPLDGVAAALVHGCTYFRPTEFDGDEEAWGQRAEAAEVAWQERRWRAEVDQWFDHDRHTVRARNRDLQAVDLAALGDAGLAAHLAAVLGHFEALAERNMATHGGDLMPVGDLLAHCEQWGIAPTEALMLLTGSSPATVETATLLAPVAQAVRSASTHPASVSDVRSLGAEAAAAVDEWLEQHTWRAVTSDDVDRPTLAELPALQLRALLHAAQAVAPGGTPTDQVRARVPEDDRDLFDSLVAEARYGNPQRDDIRGLCWNWPSGLVRRALLEAGRRLVARGALYDVEHVAELTPEELERLLVDGTGPSAQVAAERAAERDAVEAAPPPRGLGEPEAPPPLEELPPAMARATMALMAALMLDARNPDDAPLSGTGIGTVPYRGRARVLADDAGVLDLIEPGDVLVARFTGPSMNSFVPLLGAMVVEEGGPLCHAAIVAREFGMPAVIGASGATTLIADGALVEVDPVAGAVRLV